MKNLIKEYIESGKTFDNLKEEFGISVNVFDDLICLTYSQIDSPKTENIVRQCRGIVLDKNTLDIVHYPFFRFYNFEEVFEERSKINWDKVYALEKVDGSLCGCFYYKDKWYISSRSQIGGNNKINNLFTFGDLFDRAIKVPREEFFSKLDKNIDYTFELVSPLNIIVTPYTEDQLYLIGARDKNNNFKELDIYINRLTIDDLSIKLPKRFSLIDENGNFKGFEEMKGMANSLPNSTDEGFVVVDYTSYNSEFGYYPRIKVKNNSYIALHHLKGTFDNGTMNYGNILEIVMKNEQDEVLATFPQYKSFFDDVKEKYDKFINEINSCIEKYSKYWNMSMEERSNKDIKKEFALNIDKRFSSFLFIMFNKNMSFKQVIDMNMNTKKNYGKDFWENYISKF